MVDRRGDRGPDRRIRQLAGGWRQIGIEQGVEDIDKGNARDDAGEQVGPHVGNRAHQRAARGIAERHDASGRPVAGFGQIFGDRDEIRESVDLVLAASGIVPTLALFAPAADVGDGVDEAAVDQREQIGIEIGLEEIAVGTVTPRKAAPSRRSASLCGAEP